MPGVFNALAAALFDPAHTLAFVVSPPKSPHRPCSGGEVHPHHTDLRNAHAENRALEDVVSLFSGSHFPHTGQRTNSSLHWLQRARSGLSAGVHAAGWCAQRPFPKRRRQTYSSALLLPFQVLTQGMHSGILTRTRVHARSEHVLSLGAYPYNTRQVLPSKPD